MKKFVINIAVKILYTVIIFGFHFLFNSIAISQVNVYENKSLFIIGDSHSRHGLDPEKISKSCVNYSQGAEPLSLSYFKIEDVVKRTEVDTIILSFSPHNISIFNDKKFVDDNWSKALMQRAYSLPIHYYEGLIDDKELCKVRLRNMGLFPKLYHDDFLGRYEPLDSTSINLSEMRLMETVKKHYSVDSENGKLISEVQLKYFNKIVTLCDQSNVHLILWCGPLHRDYLDRVPDEVMNEYNKILNSYPSILNFIDMTLDDSSFRDHDHLNQKGASIVSSIVRQSLNNKLSYGY